MVVSKNLFIDKKTLLIYKKKSVFKSINQELFDAELWVISNSLNITPKATIYAFAIIFLIFKRF